MTKTAGFSLIELMIVIAIMAALAAMAVPTFISYRNKSRVAQVVGSSEVIRSALASYAADSSGNAYPLTGAITDFSSLRLVVNKNGGMLPSAAIFTLGNYAYYDSDGDGIADTYSMRLIVNGVSPSLLGSQILLTPEGILKCTPSGHPC
jgi:prepilin-type N-terminal cleavage/methylation domain-containing protein